MSEKEVFIIFNLAFLFLDSSESYVIKRKLLYCYLKKITNSIKSSIYQGCYYYELRLVVSLCCSS